MFSLSFDYFSLFISYHHTDTPCQPTQSPWARLAIRLLAIDPDPHAPTFGLPGREAVVCVREARRAARQAPGARPREPESRPPARCAQLVHGRARQQQPRRGDPRPPSRGRQRRRGVPEDDDQGEEEGLVYPLLRGFFTDRARRCHSLRAGLESLWWASEYYVKWACND